LKKTPLLITAGIVVTLVAGYFAYVYFFRQESITAWNLVPDNALMVFERDDCELCAVKIENSLVAKVIESAALYAKPLDSLQTVVEQTLMSSKKLTISLHSIKKDEFDLLFYLTLTPAEWNVLSDKIKLKRARLTKREFGGREVHEIDLGGHVFSWTLIENVWVGTFTPFLVEDAIRSYNAGGNFTRKVSDKNLAVVRGDAGNLYLQLSRMSDLVAIFSPEGNAFSKMFGASSLLDVKAEEGNVVLNGFSTDSVDQKNYLLSIFRHQSPVGFTLKEFISDRTLALYSFGINDGAAFKSDLDIFCKKNSIRTPDSAALVCRESGIDLNTLYAGINNEINVCLIESLNKKRVAKILIIETANVNGWLSAFDKLSNKYSVDTVFYEAFSQYVIKKVPLFRFPEKLLAPLVSGFDNCFYTSIENKIFIGDDVDELKNFLADIDDENTWGKSVSYNSFLETTLLESNVSLYLNTNKIWNVLTPLLHPKWQQFVKENHGLLSGLQLSAFQFSHLSNSYYTNISINYKPYTSDSRSPRKGSGKKTVVNFESDISGIFAVRSHINRLDEVLVQDSVNDLRLISSEGATLWKIAIGERITSDVSQIDFFGNGKLQYFFTTRDAMYVIDRLGNYVEPFPVRLTSLGIQYASVIDYDRSKKYRFLLCDASGKLWMYDKSGSNLEGWVAKDAGGSLIAAPRHYRILGKDYIIAVRKDGVVNLYTRRGEAIRNFPLNLQTRLSGDFFLEKGSSLQNTFFVVVASDGYKIRFSMDGKVQSRETLLKTSVASRFALVSEDAGKDYFITQQDTRQFGVHDDSGRRFISNETIASNPVSISCYDFGGGKIYVSVTDLLQGMTYVYDASGLLLTQTPIPTSLLCLRPHSEDEVRLFFVQKKSLIIQSLAE
jgi:hypothetical protein